jgi:hypothetical protein
MAVALKNPRPRKLPSSPNISTTSPFSTLKEEVIGWGIGGGEGMNSYMQIEAWFMGPVRVYRANKHKTEET